MSLPNLEHIKASMHVDGDDDDAVLLELRDSAAVYFQSIGVAFDPEDCPKPIAQAITLYVKHFYDHGMTFSDESGDAASIRLPWAVMQLVAPYREIAL